MDFLLFLSQLATLPSWLSAFIALLVAIIPSWRRAAPPTGVLLLLFAALALHAYQVTWAAIQALGIYFGLESFEVLGPGYYVESLIIAAINLPAFIFWLSIVRRTLRQGPAQARRA